jgi:tRNA(Met) C34 N-acetyltransferase TmcA
LLGVKPDYQRSGVGSSSLKELKKYAVHQKFDWVATYADRRAIEFFQK